MKALTLLMLGAAAGAGICLALLHTAEPQQSRNELANNDDSAYRELFGEDQ